MTYSCGNKGYRAGGCPILARCVYAEPALGGSRRVGFHKPMRCGIWSDWESPQTPLPTRLLPDLHTTSHEEYVLFSLKLREPHQSGVIFYKVATIHSLAPTPRHPLVKGPHSIASQAHAAVLFFI